MNIKDEFLEWFSKHDTYSQLSETTKIKYIEKYVEFLGFDPFELNDDLSNKEEIKAKILNRSEELRKSNSDYLEFQSKSSNGAPAAILGKNNYFVFLDVKDNSMLDLTSILNRSEIQLVMQEPEFYFQKGQDALNKWLNLTVTDELKNTLIVLSKDYNKIQEEAATRDDLRKILDLLFEIIAYCDKHAKEKINFNQYDDKRALADAFVRMNNWTEKLILYKFLPEEVGSGSTQNAFDYLLNPEHNSSILSENHRKLISENFIKKNYNPKLFVADLESFFDHYNLKTVNPKNYSHLLMLIVYSFQDKWRRDDTGKPTQFSEIIEQLKTLIEDDSDTKGLFVFTSTHRGFVWIQDSLGLIGDSICHYEIRCLKSSLTVDVHFEGKKLIDYQQFDPILNNLPKELKRIKWRNEGDSIRYGNGIKLDDPNLLNELKNQLYFIEVNLGSKLREIIKPGLPGEKSNNLEQPLNQILFGPPGTGKTYTTINKAISIANPDFDLSKPRNEIKQEFERLMKEGQVVFTTFHQSMSYEDFIEGIKPIKPSKDDSLIKYDVLPGIFKKVCQDAKTPNLVGFDAAFEKLKDELTKKELLGLETPTGKNFSISLNSNDNLTVHTGPSKEKQGTMTKENIQKQINGEVKFRGWEGYFKGVVNYLKNEYKYSEGVNESVKNYVLIIDEINRGNVSQIFGELITLIEEDKRVGKDEVLEVTLPYSKDKFSVPSNVYIIGTMNTADRSVEAIDTALRRRFSFKEMPPKYDLKELQYEYAGIKGSEILQTLNKRIEKLLDKDHQLGHSYFMINGGEKEEKKLINSLYRNIIPLLQEYFFGDFGKIGLVLGEGFVKMKTWDKKTDSFAEFDYQNSSEFDEREVFEIMDYRKPDTKYKMKIKDKEIVMDFQKAIKLLMKIEIE